jgi:hypothetical protein
MPSKSVVFAHEERFLTPLLFRQARTRSWPAAGRDAGCAAPVRQMAGRAGRRGYDNVGNILFFGLSRTTITHLMGSGETRRRLIRRVACSLSVSHRTCGA